MGCRLCSIEANNDQMEIRSNEFENYFEISTPFTKSLGNDQDSADRTMISHSKTANPILDRLTKRKDKNLQSKNKNKNI